MATISVVVILFLSLSVFWFWTSLEIIAGLLVAAGCWGEWYLFKNPADEDDGASNRLHHSREVRCIIAVAIGVTVEFAALAHSIPEAVRLEKQVSQIGTTNAQLIADNLVLRSNVAVLEAAVQWREISPTQTLKLNEALKALPADFLKNVVYVEVSGADAEAVRYAGQICNILRVNGLEVFLNSDLSFAADPSIPIPTGVGIALNLRLPDILFFNGIFNAFLHSDIPMVSTSPYTSFPPPPGKEGSEERLTIFVWHKPEK